MDPQTENDLDFGPTMRGLREGLKMFERYTLVRMLGRGGMGVVWQAHDEKLELDIAMKFLHENLVGDDAALDDLRRETRRCMKLHHTNIVQVYDLVDDPGSAAIAMEFIDGRPFSALRMDKPSRVLDAEDLLPLLEQVCAALSYAHETARIVHHDLKPGNLMLTRDGIVKVMDFGIASSLNDSMSRNSRAGQQSSSGSGTLPYMSPQQLMGFPPSVADDVYSLGATLYELLSSKPPFFRGELTRQIESITPPTIRERRVELEIEGAAPVPELWEQTIAACLEKEAEKRPQSVRELMARLTGQMAAPSTPDRASAAPPASTRASRTPTLIALAVVLSLGGVLGWWFGFEAPKRVESKQKKVHLKSAAAATVELSESDRQFYNSIAGRRAPRKTAYGTAGEGAFYIEVDQDKNQLSFSGSGSWDEWGGMPDWTYTCSFDAEEATYSLQPLAAASEPASYVVSIPIRGVFTFSFSPAQGEGIPKPYSFTYDRSIFLNIDKEGGLVITVPKSQWRPEMLKHPATQGADTFGLYVAPPKTTISPTSEPALNEKEKSDAEEKQRQMAAQPNANELETQIDKTFVPMAERPEPATTEDEWNKQRDAWMLDLKDKVFNGWPKDIASVSPQERSRAERDGIHMTAYEFESQSPIYLRLYIVHRDGLRPEDLELVVLKVLDEEGWDEFCATYHSRFGKIIDILPGAESDDKAFEEDKVMFENFKWGMAYVCPRGIGPTAWSGSTKAQTQRLRRYYLLGQTLDGMRVWDIRRTLQTIRAIPGFGETLLWIHAHRDMAVVSLYASLFEDHVKRLDLHDMPLTHNRAVDGDPKAFAAAILNVVKYLDIPQVAAMVAMRSRVAIYSDNKPAWSYPATITKNFGQENQFQVLEPVK